MDNLAAHIFHWMCSNGIKPDKVDIVIRAKDDQEYAQLQLACRRQVNPLLMHDVLKDVRKMRVHGVNIIPMDELEAYLPWLYAKTMARIGVCRSQLFMGHWTPEFYERRVNAIWSEYQEKLKRARSY